MYWIIEDNQDYDLVLTFITNKMMETRYTDVQIIIDDHKVIWIPREGLNDLEAELDFPFLIGLRENCIRCNPMEDVEIFKMMYDKQMFHKKAISCRNTLTPFTSVYDNGKQFYVKSKPHKYKIGGFVQSHFGTIFEVLAHAGHSERGTPCYLVSYYQAGQYKIKWLYQNKIARGEKVSSNIKE